MVHPDAKTIFYGSIEEALNGVIGVFAWIFMGGLDANEVFHKEGLLSWANWSRII